MHGALRYIVRIGLGATALAALTYIAFKIELNLSSVTSIFVFLITLVAMKWGLLESSILSLLAVPCLDYYFTEPRFTFTMTDSRDWVALLTFEGVALLVSRLSNQAMRNAESSESRRLSLLKLYSLSESVLMLERQGNVDKQLVELLQQSLEATGVCLWNGYISAFTVCGTCTTRRAQLEQAFTSQKEEDGPSQSTRMLRMGTRTIGAMVVHGESIDRESVSAFASVAAMAIEQARSFTAESNALAIKQSEQLRAAVLDGLAHAIKTPLTTIKTSSSGLLAINTLCGVEHSLVSLIDQQATHINDLTSRLLRTARVDSAELKVRREYIEANEAIRDCLREAATELQTHRVRTILSSPELIIWVDPQLFSLALFQLIDNASKYGSADTPITIEATESPAEIVITVQNEGSFLATEERQHVFRRFYRSPGAEHRAAGTGIGLSVVKHIAEAHHGKAAVTSSLDGKTTFSMSFSRSMVNHR